MLVGGFVGLRWAQPNLRVVREFVFLVLVLWVGVDGWREGRRFAGW